MDTTLDQLKEHSSGIIKNISEDIEEKKRLNAMGIRAGIEVEMIQNNGLGGVKIRIQSSKFILSRTLAKKIILQSESK